MPATAIGLFDSFDNLDQIQAAAVSIWLKPAPQLTQIENYLANKILYPRSLPVTKQDMQLDLAILREAIKLNIPNQEKQSALLGNNPFLNLTMRKILIPARFLEFVPNLATLALVFVDVLLLNRTRQDWFQDIWTVVLTNISDEIVGSVVLPQFKDRNSLLRCQVMGKNYEIHPGALVVLPCPKDRCEIGYSLQGGKILGQEKSAIEVYGGELGLIIDGRSI